MLPVVVLLTFLSQSPSTPKVDLARAKQVFDSSCAGCHGPEGKGGKGPSLAVPKLRHARTDDELVQTIVGGIPGTQMPPSWYLGTEGVTLVVVYVRTLQANATPPRVEGDVANGKALYDGKGKCANCHTIGAMGHAFGPDLSNIGGRRSAASLHESLAEPNAEVADAYVPVVVITSQGNTVSGICVNEDNFSIQVLDSSGRFHSFRKSALSKIDKRSGESPMPSYKTLFSDTEMNDVVAYLSSLRGEQ